MDDPTGSGRKAGTGHRSLVDDVLDVLARGGHGSETLGAAVETAGAGVGADAIALVTGAGGRATAVVHRGRGPAAALVDVPAGGDATVDLPGAGRCTVAVMPLAREGAERLVVARAAPFDDEERGVLTAVSHALGLACRLGTALADERALVERSRLLERLTRIQRSLSHGAPLQDVLDAVTSGAAELIGVPIAGIRLIDPDSPTDVVLRAGYGIRPELLHALRRGPVSLGAGGRAISEGRLVVVSDYEHADGVLEAFAADHLQVAMAAPIHEHGDVVGSLTVASYEPRRRFNQSERDALLALAEHASQAVTDAKTVAALREARQAQELFFATVSHELKTPLTAILGTLRTVERYHDALPPARLEQLVSAAHERGRDLAGLIDRLLEGARAELSTAPREIRLPDLVADAVRGFPEVTTVAPDVPDIALVVDVEAVRAVVGTLLENALAHASDRTGITVTANVEDGQVAVAVRNPGTLPDDVDPADLFRPFRRGANARSSGVGLGLYIAARLAASLRGRIDVDAAAPGSVAFVLRFPLDGEASVGT